MRLSPFDDEEPPLDHANNIIDTQLYKDVARQIATHMVKTEDGSSLVWESRFKRKSWKLLDEGRWRQPHVASGRYQHLSAIYFLQERQQFHLEQLRAAEFRARTAAQAQLTKPERGTGAPVVVNKCIFSSSFVELRIINAGVWYCFIPGKIICHTAFLEL